MATFGNELTGGEELSLRIREVRRIAGKKQGEFASIIGVSRSYLSEVEARKTKPSIEMILGVASKFPAIAGPYWFLLGIGYPGPYIERLSFPGLDLQCVQYCLRLLERADIKRQIADNAELSARALSLLINVYVSAYQTVLLELGSPDDARMEAEGRSSQIAAGMEADLDEVTYSESSDRAHAAPEPPQ